MNPRGEPKTYDAILVAGEGKASYRVRNQHKAFLEIGGKCVVTHIVEALRRTETVRNIYVVGVKDKLEKTFADARLDLAPPKPVRIIEQKSNVYENVWTTFLQTLPEGGNIPDLDKSEFRDRAVLVVPCDSPLITPHEIDYFIMKSDMENHDYVMGLVAEENLRHFYPRDGRPGIKMAYLYMKENSYRINNLHLVKPLRIRNRNYIQEMYKYRYQRNVVNVILLAWKLLGKDKLERFKYYAGLESCLLFAHFGINKLVEFCRHWTPKREMEGCISRILKTRFEGIEVPFPGAALDIDNDEDYAILHARFDEWRDYLARLAQKFPLPLAGEYVSRNQHRASSPAIPPERTSLIGGH